MTLRVILAGCGNMGYAMLSGWLRSAKLQPQEVFVIEPHDELRRRAQALGVKAADTPDAIPGDAAPSLVIFAVKPQLIGKVVPDYRRFCGGQTTFLSVAAGTPIAVFEDILGKDAAIIRCMPNTPAAICEGMMVVTGNGHVSVEMRSFVDDLLAVSGKVTGLDDESLMDAVTAVSGSGPAYLFHFIECLTAAAQKAGLPSATAELLAMQTVYGAALLAARSQERPARLREQVTSPNGTTEAALGVLMGENRLKNLLCDAVEAARRRAVELGK